ncbi:hypothetical protein BDK51DRAFT_49045 [Blyttiomyces helicus]|uniref:Uncharacterized protein n=1 Tax=Blyttiomyces helicus TaxID=388810 RepID=A0A4V1ISG6_9FUNG|nr:hypothetical protein BDK51DRAFT_49045 [Blyttiomyces helicus]|eukprot:RKO93487.1 hypothetical protein BDK51DRAFT_49045 [Blyttiomyces helicus]
MLHSAKQPVQSLNNPQLAPSSTPRALASILKNLGCPLGTQQPDGGAQVVAWAFADEALAPFLGWLCEALPSPDTDLDADAAAADPDDASQNEALLRPKGRPTPGRGVDVFSEQEVQAINELTALGLIPEERDSFWLEEDSDDDEDWESAETTQWYSRVTFANVAELHTGVGNPYAGCPRLCPRASRRKSELASVNDVVSQALADAELSISNMSLKLDAVMKDLLDRASLLISRTHERERSDLDAARSFFFQCGHDIESLLNIDRSLTKELDELFDVIFDEGFAKSLQDDGPEHYILRGANGSRTHLKETLNAESDKEIERLKSIYPDTESQKLSATLRLKAGEARLRVLEEALARSNELLADSEYLSHQAASNEAEARETADLADGVKANLNPLWRSVAEFEVRAPILAGDYDLKLERQKRMLGLIDQFIGLLLAQHARMQMLSIAFSTEFDGIRSAASILATVEKEMDIKRADVLARKACLNHQLGAASQSHPKAWMALPEHAGETQVRRTVDSRDTLAIDIKRALEMRVDWGKDPGVCFISHRGCETTPGTLVFYAPRFPPSETTQSTRSNVHLHSAGGIVLSSVDSLTAAAEDWVARRAAAQRAIAAAEQTRLKWMETMYEADLSIARRWGWSFEWGAGSWEILADTEKTLTDSMYEHSVSEQVLLAPKTVYDLEGQLRARTGELQPLVREIERARV